MKDKLIISLIFIVPLFFSLGSYALSFAKTYPYPLDKSEYFVIEAASCKKYDSKIVSLNAYQNDIESKEVFAYVECVGALNKEGKLPFYTENCYKNTIWNCESAGGGYQIEINDRKLNLILYGVPLELAEKTLSKISNAHFQSRSINELIGEKCSVSYAGSKEELEYDCGWRSRITVSLFCPTSYCPRILWIN